MNVEQIVYSLSKCINKNEGNLLRFIRILKLFLFDRQKDMQRKLEKITELVRLIVQKMEIRTEVEGDDTNLDHKNEKFIKMQKFRQTLNVARRFSRLRSSNGSIPTLFEHSEKV